MKLFESKRLKLYVTKNAKRIGKFLANCTVSFVAFVMLSFHGVQAEEAVKRPQPVTFDSLSQLLLALMIVIGVIFLAAWVMKRFNVVSMHSNSPISAVASYSLGTREKVVLLSVGGNQILVGVTPQKITLLQSFDSPVVDEEKRKTHDFSQKLQDILRREQSS